MQLVWYGAYSFRDVLTDSTVRVRFSVPGVYVWYETPPNSKRQLCYVGKATKSTTLWGRHLQHYASLVGGLYQIPKEFGGWGKDWFPDWRRENVSAAMLDQSQFLDVVKAGFKRAEAVEIYFCPIIDDVDLSQLERQLLYDLKPTGTKRGTVSEPVDKLEIAHMNRPW